VSVKSNSIGRGGGDINVSHIQWPESSDPFLERERLGRLHSNRCMEGSEEI
jgi:hypothetical protein